MRCRGRCCGFLQPTFPAEVVSSVKERPTGGGHREQERHPSLSPTETYPRPFQAPLDGLQAPRDDGCEEPGTTRLAAGHGKSRSGRRIGDLRPACCVEELGNCRNDELISRLQSAKFRRGLQLAAVSRHLQRLDGMTDGPSKFRDASRTLSADVGSSVLRNLQGKELEMTAFVFTGTLVFCFVSGGNLADAQPSPGREGESINLNDLPAVGKPFKVAPYVRAGAVLQKMGKEEGCKQLAKLAKQGDEGQVALLCRMLFSKKEKPFRPPLLGEPAYLGGTSDDDWPLSPLEFVDDVPFVVVRGYTLEGKAETSLQYLNFCLENCEWSGIRLEKITDEGINKALEKLLASKKWKSPLVESERQFLSSQIK